MIMRVFGFLTWCAIWLGGVFALFADAPRVHGLEVTPVDVDGDR